MRLSIRRVRPGQWLIWRNRHHVVLTRIPARVERGEALPAEWEVEVCDPRHHIRFRHTPSLLRALRFIRLATRNVATR